MTATTTPSIRDRILDTALQLVLDRGFSATSIDAVLSEAGASKGAFFHHFPTKAALGHALVERYARADAEVLDRLMTAAEAITDDPARQLVEFIRGFEKATDEHALTQPGCLFVSFIYEHVPDDSGIRPLIIDSIELWRSRVLEKLEAATAVRPPGGTVDLPALADHVFTTFEGGFILARATGDFGKLSAQLAQLRTYLALVLGVEPD